MTILTDIAVRCTHGLGSDTKDGLDSLTRPAELRDDLLVGQSSEGLDRGVDR